MKTGTNYRELLKHKKIKKVSFLTYILFRLILTILNIGKKSKYIYHFKKNEFKNKQVILLADHSSKNNFKQIVYGFKNRKLHSITGYQNFFDKGMYGILTKAGAVAKYLYSPDVGATKDMLSLLKMGESLLLFPEGIQSTSGYTHPINPATAKLLKKANCDIILCKSFGAYLVNNRYSQNKIKGPDEFEYIHLFTKEDLNNLSLDDIYQKLLNNFKYNDFEWLEKHPDYTYSGTTNLIKDIENILFYCPNCNSKFTLKSNDEYLECTNCKNKLTMNNRYKIEKYDETSKTTIDRLDKYNMKQRDIVRQDINNEGFSYTYQAKLRLLNDLCMKDETYSYVGEGLVIIDKDNFIYKGTKNGEDVTLIFPIVNLPSSVVIINKSGLIGNYFYYEQNYYSFIVENKCIPPYVTMLIEELHNKLDPAWNKAFMEVENHE